MEMACAVGMGRPELTPLERETAARILGSNPYLRVSFLDEGGSLLSRDRRRLSLSVVGLAAEMGRPELTPRVQEETT
jgi:hypothetical protein